VIVDDEPLARQTLRVLLSREADFVIVGECAHGASAIDTIVETRPAVVFLDVQMPAVDGFDVLRHIDAADPPLVVFVTAYDKYALQAFERQAFDYLLKPFADERFAAVLDRVRQRLDERDKAQRADRLRDLLAHSPAVPRRSLLVRDGGKTVVVPHEEILWIEAEDYCVRIHLGGRDLLVRDSLRALAQELPESGFVRVHRSAIANLNAIRSIEPAASGDQRVTLTDGTTLKASRTHRAGLLEALSRRR
jgi:two-component system, LytTR family, response regulator